MTHEPSPAGALLLRLLRCGLREIMLRESANESLIHLYNTGAYWVAFERSAYQLRLLIPRCGLVPLRCSGHPSPLMMASVRAEELCAVLSLRPSALNSRSYEVIPAPVLCARSYGDWHKRGTEVLKNIKTNHNERLYRH